jgi:hypothetical protein
MSRKRELGLVTAARGYRAVFLTESYFHLRDPFLKRLKR